LTAVVKKNKNAGSPDKKNILPTQLGSSIKRIKPTSPASPALATGSSSPQNTGSAASLVDYKLAPLPSGDGGLAAVSKKSPLRLALHPLASGYPKCVLANAAGNAAAANGGGANKLIPVKKHFPVSTQEWDNSIYAYNVKNSILMPAIDKMVIKLIKSYFNAYMAGAILFSYTKKRLNRSPKLNLSVLNKRYVSKPEIKHTNSKVIITIYKYISKKYMEKLKKLQCESKSLREENNKFSLFSFIFSRSAKKNKNRIRRSARILKKKSLSGSSLLLKKVRKNFFTSFFTPVIRKKKSLLKKYKNKR